MESVPKDLAELDTCPSLYLREIGEPKQNCLRLLIEEALVMPEEVTVKFAGAEITNCHPVRSTTNSRLFEIVWDNYVAYSVANESYSSGNESEEFSGRFARLYAKSCFLDYISRATLVSKEYPGPLQHIELVCECHIVDVVSTMIPRVTHMRPRPNLQ
ncbi:MAG: hypothetical protein WCF26_06445 [Candidatus Sulfotelmatobacter sp.]